MSNKTGISWTDATWNPIRGCSRVSEGCRNCYAERVAVRFCGPGMPYEGLANPIAPRDLMDRVGGRRGGWTREVRMVPEHLADPLRWRKPRRIFVNSMSDLFHEALTNEQIAAVFGVMAAAPQHTFQVLTKRAKRMREWFAWLLAGEVSPSGKCFEAARGTVDFGSWYRTVPQQWPLPNVWLGVSVENQAAANERIPELLATPAAVRFLSCEPLIGDVALSGVLVPLEGGGHDVLAALAGLRWGARRDLPPGMHLIGARGPSIDWVIAGCESGPGARPCDVAWLRSLRDQCIDADVPFFLKQARVSAETSADPSDGVVRPAIRAGIASNTKPGGVIELPYLDGVQWAEFPAVPR